MATNWNGVLRGTEEVIDRHIPHEKYSFWHGRFGKALTNRPSGFSARTLLDDLMAEIERNVRTVRESEGAQLGKSEKNWRELSPTKQHETRRAERDLEHKISNTVGLGDSEWIWWNQMPIASGLVGHRADRTRAIDLASRCKKDPSHYRLIELKVTPSSGTPMFAMIEIVLYALVYLVLRKNRGEKWLSVDWLRADIFSAKRIDLCVLAPVDYYEGYDLGWLEQDLTTALAYVCKENFGDALTMTLTNCALTGIPKWSDVNLEDRRTLQGLATEWVKIY
jgi:hypothetical protein